MSATALSGILVGFGDENVDSHVARGRLVDKRDDFLAK